MKKLVETKDDNGDKIVGIKDGSIDLMSWDEKTRTSQKKVGIKSKVLFIGKTKNLKNLILVLDIKMDEYGTKYGWAGSQAAIYNDIDALIESDSVYEGFLKKIETLPIPKEYKKDIIEIDNDSKKG